MLALFECPLASTAAAVQITSAFALTQSALPWLHRPAMVRGLRGGGLDPIQTGRKKVEDIWSAAKSRVGRVLGTFRLRMKRDPDNEMKVSEGGDVFFPYPLNFFGDA